ncbi:MAG: sulfotransferase family protein [Candidatus Obscuribacterales bacterium]|nr:sulfotransferase family protein [Candidatus Obscuribacterales bacterium]
MNWHRVRRYLLEYPWQALNARVFGRYLVPNVVPGRKALFIHIPKNAGTSIYKALGLKYSDHLTAREYKILLGPAYQNIFKFAFIRDPWERFLSNYWYAKMDKSYYHGGSQTQHQDHELLKEASLLECAQHLLAGRLVHGRKNHSHWEPQYKWLYDQNDVCIVDWIGRVEFLSKDVNELAAMLGMPLSIKHLNASERRHEIEWTEENKEALLLVRQYYEKDFALLGRIEVKGS